MTRESDAQDKALLLALIRIIKVNPRAVREALGLPTDEDIKAQEEYQDAFSKWKSDRVKSMRDRGILP